MITRGTQRPPSAPASPAGGRGTSHAQSAAITANSSRYTPLRCGHFTDKTEIDSYSAWAPSKRSCWCEKCGNWQYRKPQRKIAYPQEPLF